MEAEAVTTTSTTEQELFIGEGFSLSIGDGYELLIQEAGTGNSWTAETI